MTSRENDLFENSGSVYVIVEHSGNEDVIRD